MSEYCFNESTASSQITSSLFPESVADRIFQKTVAAAGEFQDTTTPYMTNHYDSTEFRSTNNNKNGMKSFLESSITKSKIHDHQSGSDHFQQTDTEPIADLSPSTSVLFADISAWSSSREPVKFYVLLQNIYQAFDIIAKRRHVSKVETISGSYVAVIGCPDVQEHHVIIMSRFATEYQRQMEQVTSTLDARLGPGTPTS